MSNTSNKVEQQIAKLRSVLSTNPNRPKPKALARLSYLLAEEAKTCAFNNDGGVDIQKINAEKSSEVNDTKQKLGTEAYELAKQSIEIDPLQSNVIGYGALSISSPKFEERMWALEQIVSLTEPNSDLNEASTKSVNAIVPRAVSLVRLLLEPRDEEALELNGVRQSSSKHPTRREWDNKEKKLYQKSKESLELASSLLTSNTSGNTTVSSNSTISEQVSFLAKSHYRLGMTFRKMIPEEKHRSSSIHHFTQAIEILPKHHSMARKCAFWLATFGSSGEGCNNVDSYRMEMDCCPEEYIVSLYSTFASNFDDLLVKKLKYETPTKLRKVVDQVVQEKNYPVMNSNQPVFQQCVDLGCGTGLSGLAFQDCTSKLYGVDLSPEMIEKANLRDVYDELVVGNVESIFSNSKIFPTIPIAPSSSSLEDTQRIDLVLACDVFVYIGDLKPIFTKVRQQLHEQHGLFAFSTEYLSEEDAKVAGEGNEKPFLLQTCARFAHTVKYLEALAKEMNFEIYSLSQTVIRQNQGKDVKGILAVLGCC